MEIFQNLVLPFTITGIILYGLYKKLPVFTLFTKGAKKAVGQLTDLLPSLTALIIAVSMLSASGGTEILCNLLSPAADLLGIPKEVLPLCLISPLSGSGSLAVLEEILQSFSPDSYIGRTASVIAGASETTFYAVTVYYSAVGITKTRHTVPAALAADVTAYIAAALYCKIL